MGVGTGVIVGLVLLSVMTIPSVYSYTDKVQEELDRLDSEYLNPNEEELSNPITEMQKRIDNKKIKIVQNDEKLITLDEQIAQNELNLLEEQKKISTQQEKINKSWDAAPINYDTLTSLEVERKFLLLEKTQLLDENITLSEQIANTTIILDIHKNGGKIIGIKLSGTCEKLVQLGNDTCPSYQDLLSMDNSNYAISGELKVDDGWFHRVESPFHNDSFGWYSDDDNLRILVDPPANMQNRIKTIIIQNNFDVYTTVHDRSTDNNTITLHHDRFIDNCQTATISANVWLQVIADTIYTLRNGCEDTNYDDTYTIPIIQKVIDKTTSPQIKYESWLKKVKEECKVRC